MTPKIPKTAAKAAPASAALKRRQERLEVTPKETPVDYADDWKAGRTSTPVTGVN